jgi:hypothetical protein
MVIFRGGIAVEVPVEYARQPEHVALVTQLMATNRYADAVRLLERHVISWLAADVLTGALWSRRYLNTTARLSLSAQPADRRLAAAGTRALMHVLSGIPSKVGRHRVDGLSGPDLARAGAALAHWRAVVDTEWSAVERTGLPAAVLRATNGWHPSRAHQRALRQLVRRRHLRKHELILTLASWETGVAMRRLRAARPLADLVYG